MERKQTKLTSIQYTSMHSPNLEQLLSNVDFADNRWFNRESRMNEKKTNFCMYGQNGGNIYRITLGVSIISTWYFPIALCVFTYEAL